MKVIVGEERQFNIVLSFLFWVLPLFFVLGFWFLVFVVFFLLSFFKTDSMISSKRTRAWCNRLARGTTWVVCVCVCLSLGTCSETKDTYLEVK